MKVIDLPPYVMEWYWMDIKKKIVYNFTKILKLQGVYLPKPGFTHGQLYVAVSQVTSRKGLKLLILDEYNNVCKETSNVVYHEVFQKVWSLVMF